MQAKRARPPGAPHGGGALLLSRLSARADSSAVCSYRVPLSEGAKRLCLPSIGGACAKVNRLVLGWDPFEADVCGKVVDVEIILTRRNTFGPLHDAVKGRMHNEPNHWLTEGTDYRPEPILIPSGLLSDPFVLFLA